MSQAWENLRSLVENAVDLFALSVFVGGGLVFFLPGIQARWKYLAAAVVMGTVFGLIARESGLPEGIDLAATLLGVLTGPTTAAWAQGKTAGEAIEELRRVRRGGDGPAPDEGGDKPADG